MVNCNAFSNSIHCLLGPDTPSHHQPERNIVNISNNKNDKKVTRFEPEVDDRLIHKDHRRKNSNIIPIIADTQQLKSEYWVYNSGCPDITRDQTGCVIITFERRTLIGHLNHGLDIFEYM
jgi:hypothetical protein